MGFEQRLKRVYGLSFAPPEEEKRKHPEIVITVSKTVALHVEKLISQFEKDFAPRVFEYLGKAEKFCQGPKEKFGYGGCGKRVERDDEVLYSLVLKGGKAEELALTATLLLDALFSAASVVWSEQQGGANYQQLFHVEAGCGPRGQHASPLYGHVYPALILWLVEKGKKANQKPSHFDREAYNGSPIVPSVQKAMELAWKGVAKKELRRYAGDTYFGITPDGRFSFTCFGNACDVSIYPDQAHGMDPEMMVQFGCHNLDTPAQQITLLAGLAALHDVADKEMS